MAAMSLFPVVEGDAEKGFAPTQGNRKRMLLSQRVKDLLVPKRPGCSAFLCWAECEGLSRPGCPVAVCGWQLS